jgi:hypothetical protein
LTLIVTRTQRRNSINSWNMYQRRTSRLRSNNLTLSSTQKAID